MAKGDVIARPLRGLHLDSIRNRILALSVLATLIPTLTTTIVSTRTGISRVPMSIGIAEYPSHGDTPEELIASADAAMYRAKSQGRDRVVAGSRGPGAKGES